MKWSDSKTESFPTISLGKRGVPHIENRHFVVLLTPAILRGMQALKSKLFKLCSK